MSEVAQVPQSEPRFFSGGTQLEIHADRCANSVAHPAHSTLPVFVTIPGLRGQHTRWSGTVALTKEFSHGRRGVRAVPGEEEFDARTQVPLIRQGRLTDNRLVDVPGCTHDMEPESPQFHSLAHPYQNWILTKVAVTTAKRGGESRCLRRPLRGHPE